MNLFQVLSVAVLPLLACCAQVDKVSPELASPDVPAVIMDRRPDLELRILEVVLIDPRTGNSPPMEDFRQLSAPAGVPYPLVLEYPDRDTDEDPFMFRLTWCDDVSAKRFVKVHVKGFKPMDIGLKYTKREQAHVMLSKRIQRIVELESIEEE